MRPRDVSRRALLALLVVSALAILCTSARATSAALPRVTVIGDSVAAAIQIEPDALKLLSQGIDLDPQLAVCRRLTGESCPYNGSRPPTLVDLASSLGSTLGPTVIVAVGYNDSEDTFSRDIETSLAALRQAGVKNVFWVTLRAERQSYLSMNDAVRTAAAGHPELTVVDWNVYSRSHPDWFQADGLHLDYKGAVAMATLLHKSLVEAGIAPAPLVISAAKLPLAHVGRTYSAHLGARGGKAPYRWLAASLPRGLHLQATGRIIGTPALAGRTKLRVRVTDASGHTVLTRVELVVSK